VHQKTRTLLGFGSGSTKIGFFKFLVKRLLSQHIILCSCSVNRYSFSRFSLEPTMMKPQHTRFVLALLCALTVSSIMFLPTIPVTSEETTDQEGNIIITTRDLGRVRIFQIVCVLKGRHKKSQCTNHTFTKRRGKKVATALSNLKVQSLVRA